MRTEGITEEWRAENQGNGGLGRGIPGKTVGKTRLREMYSDHQSKVWKRRQ